MCGPVDRGPGLSVLHEEVGAQFPHACRAFPSFESASVGGVLWCMGHLQDGGLEDWF